MFDFGIFERKRKRRERAILKLALLLLGKELLLFIPFSSLDLSD